ncbi:glycosyl hydrolase family 61-domain-containing protein [Tricharina praecox]|uniref:glycosyl hydrolase family 61-domain-containing protein n=1 Tax=Tricharina praecox TaxID=43433 RepID=UPI002220B59A|nr:glycosyl hydrolase family 61-domain-containing protein [Tricharina praecox]KAI5848282.1 glycosyl hydrolase family 61-domain-containing protein [Tricharina praecox]
MKSQLLFALLGATCTLAHHMVSNVWIDGVNQGAGTCMRTPLDTSPMTDITASTMACNVNGNRKFEITCPANAGSTVTIQWRTWPDGSNDSPIDVSHQGPCAVYMKRMGDNGDGEVAGGGWFKIWQDGFRDGEFCTERLRKNGNRMVVKIPEDLAGGYYTLRAEHLALHQAQSVGGAQWYVGCAQLFLYSTGGNTKPGNTVSIPGYVSAQHPGVHYDYWLKKGAGYKMPGPEPYVKTNSGGGNPIKVPFTPHKYGECLVKNANWCAVSPPAHNNEVSCWKASQNCWKQLDTCYAEAPITGNKGCKEWEKRCENYLTACHKCTQNGCQGSKVKRVRRAMRGHKRRHTHQIDTLVEAL